MRKNFAIILISFLSTILSSQTKLNLADLSTLENAKIVVLRLEINATPKNAGKLGQKLMSKILNNNSNTNYDIVP
ncbi:hypothetical protein P700755_000256 [Psychroflexus torquis ATCC 700755]|uniref:Uncharacterized protein n=1 Tax=Psychroflexus torquis (strain ATCC 700755 / CIP 106069 / ACAM 623) TaxID=313595 RepID=K4IA45_PSYTT|nr:hypothetical protein [Psychroflexus torquis]AFU67299.1 hypothetical protein P700755_000256 [Psychroflexus torquis ATCC 700755]